MKTKKNYKNKYKNYKSKNKNYKSKNKNYKSKNKNYKSKNKNYKSKNKNYKSKNKNYKSKNKNYKKKKMKGGSGKPKPKTKGNYSIRKKTLKEIIKRTKSGPLNNSSYSSSNNNLENVGPSYYSLPGDLTLVFTPAPFPEKECHKISIIIKDTRMPCHEVFSTQADGTTYITSDRLSGGAFGEVFTLSSHPEYILKYITQSTDRNPQEEVNYQKAAADEGIAPQVFTLMIHGPSPDLVPASIIMEKMDYNMKEYIIRQNPLTVGKVQELIHMVLDLTGKLQHITIYHLDIRLDNVMFSITKNKWFIIDYGIVSSDVRDLPQVYQTIKTSFIETLKELFHGIPENYTRILKNLLDSYLS